VENESTFGEDEGKNANAPIADPHPLFKDLLDFTRTELSHIRTDFLGFTTEMIEETTRQFQTQMGLVRLMAENSLLVNNQLKLENQRLKAEVESLKQRDARSA